MSRAAPPPLAIHGLDWQQALLEVPASATQEQRDAWRKAMEPVYPQIVKETGGDAAAFYAAMEAGRTACAK